MGIPALSLLASDVSVGTHVEKQVGGLTFNMDTIWATGIAMAIVFLLGALLRKQMTSGTPGRLQAAWEMLLETVTGQVESSIGPAGRSIIPLACTLFVFILTCNLFTLFGLGSKYEYFAVPTGDINLPLAMALFVIVGVHIYSVRSRGPVATSSTT